MALLAVVGWLIFLVFVLMPVLTYVRLGRLSRELEDLASRVDNLERGAGASVAGVMGAAGDTGAGVTSATGDTSATSVAAPMSPAAPVAPAAPMSPAAPVPPLSPPSDLEERIGGRGLLYTGILVLLFGVSFFLKYAFDNAWINETTRVGIGLLTGIGLVVSGVRVNARDLPVFGQALAGAGFAILYLVVYAALNFYALINRTPAFAVMTLITVAAAALADRQRSQPLAFIAVGGGFLTPALVGGGENAQLTLFTYVAVLVIGTMLLALRHQWLALNASSYVGTFVTVVAWAGRYYTDDQWLRTLLFLTLFCVAFIIIMRETRRAGGATARFVWTFLATAPVFYHLAAVVITAAHPPAVHIYLIAFTVAGLWLTVEPYRPLIRLAILIAAFVPLFGELTLPAGVSWLMPNVITIVTIALLHLMAMVDRVIRQEQRLTGSDLAALHISGLGLFALLYETTQPVWPEFRGALALLVAAGAAALWYWLRPRDGTAALNALALALTLMAIGIAVQFDGAAAIIGWAIEGAAIVWLGARGGHYLVVLGGTLLWVFAAVRLVETFGMTPASFVALLNARSFAAAIVIGSGYAMTWVFSRYSLEEARRLRAAVHVIVSFVTLGWITAEIQSFWEVRYQTTQAHFYEQMMLSLAWGLYGSALIVAGMTRRYPPLRYLGMFVIGATSLKVFFYDLWELGGIYRVVGFLGFGVLLVLVSYLYQKRNLANRSEL